MARQAYKTGILITGDAKGGVKAIELTKDELKDLNKQSKRTAKESKSAFDELKDSLFSLQGAFAAITGGALAAMVTETVSAIRELDSLSQTLDVNINTLRGWGGAAETVGLSTEKMGDIFKDVSEKLGDYAATGGGEAADAVEKLGLNINKLIQLSPDQQLLAIADGLESVGSQSEKVFLLESLANDASRLLPLLEDDAKALTEITDELERMGNALTPEDLAVVEEANKEWVLLQKSLSGFSQQVTLLLLGGGELTKVLREGVTAAANFVKALRGSDHEQLSEPFRVLAFTIKGTVLELGDLVDLYQSLYEFSVNVAGGYGLDASVDKFVADREAARQAVDDEMMAFVATLEGVGVVIDDVSKKADDLGDDLGDAFGDDARKELEKLLDTLNPAVKIIEQYTANLDLLSRAYGAGEIALSEYELSLTQLDAAYIKSLTSLSQVKDETEALKDEVAEAPQIFKDAASGIYGGIYGSFRDTFRDMLDGGTADFRDFGQRILDIFKDMIAEMATLAIARPIILPVVSALGGALGVPQSAQAGVMTQLGGSALNGLGFNPLSLFDMPFFSSGGGLSGAFGALSAGLSGSAIAAGSAAELAAFGTAAFDAIGAGGIAAGGLSAGGGFAAALGAAAPILGPLAIAAVLGGLFGGGDEPDPVFQIGTQAGGQAAGNYTRSGPFGGVGLLQMGDAISDEGKNAILEAFAAIDAGIEARLSAIDAELVDSVTAALEGWRSPEYSAENDNDLAKAVGDRLEVMFGAVDDELLAWFQGERGESLEDVERAINDALSGFAAFQNGLADIAFGGFAEFVELLEGFRAEGEELAVTAARLQLEFDLLNDIADRLGLQFDLIGREALEAADHLAEAAGGLQALSGKSAYFYENFYSDTERLFNRLADNQAAVADFNAETGADITGKGSLRAYIESLDLNTEAGRGLFDDALDLAPMLVQLETDVDTLTGAVADDFADLYASIVAEHTAAAEAAQAELEAVREAERKRYDEIREALEGLQRFADSLLVGSASPLTSQEQLDEAARQFFAGANAARGGDVDAIGRLQGLATSYLNQGQSHYGGTASDPYQAIFDTVYGTLSGFGVEVAAQQQVDELVRITETLEVSQQAITAGLSDQTLELLAGWQSLGTDLQQSLAHLIHAVDPTYDLSLLGLTPDELAAKIREDMKRHDSGPLTKEEVNGYIPGVGDGAPIGVVGSNYAHAVRTGQLPQSTEAWGAFRDAFVTSHNAQVATVQTLERIERNTRSYSAGP